MNAAAKFVLYVLGAVLALFAIASVCFPYAGLKMPEEIAKHLDALIVAFVAVLARTGKDEPVEPPK